MLLKCYALIALLTFVPDANYLLENTVTPNLTWMWKRSMTSKAFYLFDYRKIKCSLDFLKDNVYLAWLCSLRIGVWIVIFKLHLDMIRSTGLYVCYKILCTRLKTRV
jgi:hypothetical protein